MFNKTQFQKDLKTNLEKMIANESVIANIQIEHFLRDFSLSYTQYESTSLYKDIEDKDFVKSLRMLLIYNTLALTLHDPEIYAAAVQVFPLTQIPASKSGLMIDLLEYIKNNPMDIQPVLEKSLPDPFDKRISLLQKALLSRLGDSL